MIVWQFIYDREGWRLNGYVPSSSEASGVTIAAGFDLGQQGLREIAPLSNTLRERLKPYLGLMGDVARVFLRGHPLNVTDAEAHQIMEPMQRRYEVHASMHWNDDDAAIVWDRLPDGAQTALMSVIWQYWAPWAKPDLCGDFWKVALRCDWQALAKFLENFPDRRFLPRRKLEAEFLLAHCN